MTNQVTMNGLNDASKLHFVLVPLMAQGHTIPMVDMACLLADRGSLVSLITTPINAARMRAVIDRTKEQGLPIRFIELEFPCAEAGLPEGSENFDLTPMEYLKTFFEALTLLRDPLSHYLQETNPGPSCIVTDFCQSWTRDVAREFDIPRLVFHGPGCFFVLNSLTIRQSKIYETVASEFEAVIIPGLPQAIEITKAQAPGWLNSPGWEALRDQALESEATADGIVLNSFYELEPEFIDRCQKAMGKRIWPVGPLSLYDKDVTNMVSRGNKASVDEHQVLSWLDSRDNGSVIFASFGSIVQSNPSQLVEIGCGLEASNRPFIWVIKKAEKSPEVEKWMSEGFEERTRERSLIITGWAPQVAILSHPAGGGIMTHCGWNSTLEAVSAGLPMITWPHFADQFLNEKLIVEVLKIGVSLGVKLPSYYLKEDEIAVKRDDIEKTVVSLMDGGEEGKERTVRAREFGMKAQKAMEEGGSSYKNMTLLVQHLLEKQNKDA